MEEVISNGEFEPEEEVYMDKRLKEIVAIEDHLKGHVLSCFTSLY